MATQSSLRLLSSALTLLSQQASTLGKRQKTIKYCSATCPDPHCRTRLYFPSHEGSVECSNCGQRHTTSELPDRQELKESEDKFGVEVAQLKQQYATGRKTPELVMVKGISNYQCKLLSPLLTTHGMDSKSDRAKPLKDLGMGATFDCSKLSSRVFAIEETYLDAIGYGRDRSGSAKYLRDFLLRLQGANDNRECLVPVHADGDGHCLVHAVSRCLVGRELFWHALRTNLHAHLRDNVERYQEMFKDFYSEEDWPDIIAEAGPDFQPPDGQELGLRNIHIFGLANVLCRPIILVDSLSGVKSSGDYSGIFLPALYSAEECSSKDGRGELTPNSPIVVGWSTSGRNHYIPLVPIRDRPLPRLPPDIRPKVWGLPEELLEKYIKFDASGSIVLAAGKALGDGYLQKLVTCFEKFFQEKNCVVPSLVADVNQYVYKSAGYVSVSPEVVTAATRNAVEECRLYRCLVCSAASCVPPDWLRKGGPLYDKAAQLYDLEDGMQYNFPLDGIMATYVAETDRLVPFAVNCFWCGNVARPLRGDGHVVYQNGDRTSTPAHGSRCKCGFKHYWDGEEYDNLPEKIPLNLTWGQRVKQINVHWFQHESDPSMNSNVYDVAQKAVNDNFPGQFGSERLVQQVVEQILEASGCMEQVTQHEPTRPDVSSQSAAASEDLPAQKFIITGPKSKTIHKEELTASETERALKRRIEENAKHQHRSTGIIKKERAAVAEPPSQPRPPPQSSPTPSKPAKKKIRVTTWDGKMANLTLDLSTSFSEFQAAIEREFSIPPVQQKLRSGFPPKELLPESGDPSLPINLTNGEKVSVDIVAAVDPGVAMDTSGTEETAEGDGVEEKEDLDSILRGIDLWSIAVLQPQLFARGGDYYQQVVHTYGDELRDNTHFKFREFPEKTFAFSAQTQSLLLCLGAEHIAVGPLTPEQEEKARAASDRNGQSPSDGHTESESVVVGRPINKPVPSVKAFSGKGRTLGEASRATPESDNPLLAAAQVVVQKRLLTLQSRERELQTQVRGINRQFVHAEANKDGASVRDDLLSTLETKLLDLSSELKQVREEIRELTTLQ